MTTVTVSEKGQITLPAATRRRLRIKPKSLVEVEVRENEVVLRPVKSVSELSGSLRAYAEGKTTDWDEMRDKAMRAVAEEAISVYVDANCLSGDWLRLVRLK